MSRPEIDVTVEPLAADDIPAVLAIWEATASGVEYDQTDADRFGRKVFDNPRYERAGALVARVDEAVGGFALAATSEDRTTGHLCALMVEPQRQRGGIGSALLARAEGFLAGQGVEGVHAASEESPIWFSMGVNVASPAYYFLLNRGYRSTDAAQIVMEIDLSEFALNPQIEEYAADNRRQGIEFALCGAEHSEALLEATGHDPGVAEILSGEPPYSILVATKGDDVVGWSGPIWPVPGGRGAFSGVWTHPDYRRRKIATILFNLMCVEFKKGEAAYSNLYTGLQMGAQEVYFEAGFKAKYVVDSSLTKRLASPERSRCGVEEDG